MHILQTIYRVLYLREIGINDKMVKLLKLIKYLLKGYKILPINE